MRISKPKDPRETLNLDIGNCVVPKFEENKDIKFIDYMYKLTPIEQKSNKMWFKREDAFALFGINTLNGSKCRQLLYLFDNMPKSTDIVIHSTNLNSSPQTPMCAALANHYNFKCLQVGGGTSLESMNQKELPIFATLFGTKYDLTPRSGFNVVIQKRVRDLLELYPNSTTIERDITLDHHISSNLKKIKPFHEVGAYQVKNFPDFIEDLIIPFGSANSSTSILLGINQYLPKKLKNIHLVNVGVDKRRYMFERLSLMGVDISIFETKYNIIFHETKMPYSKKIKGLKVDDITFHYRYEAKVYDHIQKYHPDLINSKTLFWIIGSVPSLEVTSKVLNKDIPKSILLEDINPQDILDW